MQAARFLRSERRADDTRSVADDERHLLGRAQARRDKQIALVLTVVVIGHDDELAVREGGYGVPDTLVRIVHVDLRSAAAPSARRLRQPPHRIVADLPALTQIMICDHARHHGLADRHRP